MTGRRLLYANGYKYCCHCAVYSKGPFAGKFNNYCIKCSTKLRSIAADSKSNTHNRDNGYRQVKRY